MLKDYYEILGIDRHASTEEIKQSFRSLALHYHPDSNANPDDHSKFLAVNEAYQILGDVVKRANYNTQYDHLQRLKKIYEEPPVAVAEEEPPIYEDYHQPAYEPVYEPTPVVDEDPYSNSYRWINVVIPIVCFIFAMSMVVDYFQTNVTPIQTMLEGRVTKDQNGKTQCIVSTEEYEFSLDYEQYEKLGRGDRMILHISPVYDVLVRVDVQSPVAALVNAPNSSLSNILDGDSLEGSFSIYPKYGIYNVFSFFIAGLIIASIAAFAFSAKPKIGFKLSLASLLLGMITLILLLQS